MTVVLRSLSYVGGGKQQCRYAYRACRLRVPRLPQAINMSILSSGTSENT